MDIPRIDQLPLMLSLAKFRRKCIHYKSVIGVKAKYLREHCVLCCMHLATGVSLSCGPGQDWTGQTDRFCLHICSECLMPCLQSAGVETHETVCDNVRW